MVLDILIHVRYVGLECRLQLNNKLISNKAVLAQNVESFPNGLWGLHIVLTYVFDKTPFPGFLH